MKITESAQHCTYGPTRMYIQKKKDDVLERDRMRDMIFKSSDIVRVYNIHNNVSGGCFVVRVWPRSFIIVKSSSLCCSTRASHTHIQKIHKLSFIECVLGLGDRALVLISRLNNNELYI